MKSYSSTYKVFFMDHQLLGQDVLNLTFFKNEGNLIEIKNFSPFLIEVESFQKKYGFHSINNIEEVITFGEAEKSNILNFYIILFSKNNKEHLQRIGFLIGNHQEKGEILLGYWPYSKEGKGVTKETISSIFDDLKDNPSDYSDVLIIS